MRFAPAAAAEASRSGAHREAVAFYETALRHAGSSAADSTVRATLLEAMSVDLYLTDRLRDAIAARERAVELRRGMGEVVAVGAGHTALAGFAWYAADRALAERHTRAAIEILSTADDRRALGFALARHTFLAAWRGDAPEARVSGVRLASDSPSNTACRTSSSPAPSSRRCTGSAPRSSRCREPGRCSGVGCGPGRWRGAVEAVIAVPLRRGPRF